MRHGCPMDLAFIVDPLPELKAYKDSTVAMMRAAQARGHRPFAVLQPDVWLDTDTVQCAARALRVSDDDDDWYVAGERAVRALPEFGAVLMRKDPPFDMEYLYSTQVLELAQQAGARVFNDPRAIRDNNEKLSIAKFPDLIVPTLVTRQEERLREFVAAQRDVILKPLDAMGGASIFRVREGDPNLNVIIETMIRFGEKSVMAQRFIPEIADGDKRVLLIAGEPVPYSLARIPKAGETRGNLAAGARGVAQPLSARDREIAEAVAPVLHAEGLLLVGIDIIGDFLTEVNVTSPTCFREITDQTGFDVPGMFVDALEAAVAK